MLGCYSAHSVSVTVGTTRLQRFWEGSLEGKEERNRESNNQKAQGQVKKVEESSCAVSVNEQVNVRDIDEQQKSTNLHFKQRTLDYTTYRITFVWV